MAWVAQGLFKNMEINKIYTGDCLDVLKTFDDNSIDCCITSPPYWGLRDYGHDGQIGMEETPDVFVENLVSVFSEVKRVLKPEGTLWLNLGDTYSSHKDCKSVADTLRVGGRSEEANVIEKGKSHSRNSKMLKSVGLKNKDLVGIPWMVAFALRDNGWYLRQDIIWHKPNPMPESVTDRCTKSHEYIFLLAKSAKYYYDHEVIKTKMADSSLSRLAQDVENQVGSDRVPGKTNGKMKAVGKKNETSQIFGSRSGHSGNYFFDTGFANKRSVWTVNTMPYSEAHFATFPERLITDMIKAGCPENGIILDPFMGAGTTALVARKLHRNFVGIELNPEYVEIANKRLFKELGMFQ